MARLYGKGHTLLAPLDAATFALSQGHAAAAWRAAAAIDPVMSLHQFVTTSDRFEVGAYNAVGRMRAAYSPHEVADAQRSMRANQDSRQWRARLRELTKWRARRDEAVQMLANSPAALKSPPAGLVAECQDAVRGEVLCIFAADGDLAGVRRLLDEGVPPSSAGLARQIGSNWVKLDRRPTRLVQVTLERSKGGPHGVVNDLADGKLTFDEGDLDGMKDAHVLTLNSYVETERGEFFKPVAGAVDWARAAVAAGRGEGVAVLELLEAAQRHA